MLCQLPPTACPGVPLAVLSSVPVPPQVRPTSVLTLPGGNHRYGCPQIIPQCQCRDRGQPGSDHERSTRESIDTAREHFRSGPTGWRTGAGRRGGRSGRRAAGLDRAGEEGGYTAGANGMDGKLPGQPGNTPVVSPVPAFRRPPEVFAEFGGGTIDVASRQWPPTEPSRAESCCRMIQPLEARPS